MKAGRWVIDICHIRESEATFKSKAEDISNTGNYPHEGHNYKVLVENHQV